jgi:error-prone DNA polymerase
MKPGYAELCVTSNFTFLTGASHPEELVARAAELGLAAIAITDRNSLAGVVRAHVALRELARAQAENAATGGAEVRGQKRQDPSSRQTSGGARLPVPEAEAPLPRLIIAARHAGRMAGPAHGSPGLCPAVAADHAGPAARGQGRLRVATGRSA